MLTDKHVVVALLVAPVLAVLAWFAVGSLIGETPHAVQAGASYPLVERSNCRYASGRCDLENEDLELSLVMRTETGSPTLLMRSSHPLDAALLAVVEEGMDGQPDPMQASGSSPLEWSLPLVTIPAQQQRLRLVVNARGATWYAEVSTRWLEQYRAE